MISKEKAQAMILDLFEEEALVIGGLAAVQGLDDDLVWRLMRNLDVILDKSLRRIESIDAAGHCKAGGGLNLKRHQAVEDFLIKLRRASHD